MTRAPLHDAVTAPSSWVRRFAPHIPAAGHVLDVACGLGRHARYLAGLGYRVDAVDRDADSLAALHRVTGVTTRAADIEQAPWPYPEQHFAGIIVTNYLHKPLLPQLVASVAPGGVLIYETFALGNERYGRPTNPAFLLAPGELLDIVRGHLRVVAYENLEVAEPRPAVVQRICALRA